MRIRCGVRQQTVESQAWGDSLGGGRKGLGLEVRVRTLTGHLTVFDGADRIVELVRALVKRDKGKTRRGRPMVCLVRDANERELLPELEKRLAQASIPHARYVYGRKTGDIGDVLAGLATDLATRGGPAFPRFRLVQSLARQSRQDRPAAPLNRLRAKVSAVGRASRWLLRQPYLAPQDPGTFAGFAQRLAEPGEDQEQLLRLLVNAFLSDLRQSDRPWRAGNPVVLLDGVTGTNGGYRLLKLINDVRNETGAFDPVVVISGSSEVPPLRARGNPALPSARDALAAYRRWCENISKASRARTPSAWYLPIRVPPSPSVESDRFDEARERLLDSAPITADPPPLWARRWVLALVAVVLVAIAILVEQNHRQTHCGVPFWSAESATLQTAEDGECVGVTASGFAFRPSDKAFTDMQARVGELNRRAEEADRPVATLVFAADRVESLSGAVMVQEQQLAKTGANEPVLRILLANTGSRPGDVTELLRDVAAADSSIVGSVGFGEAAEAFRAAGLSVVSSVPGRSKRGAAVAAAYAASQLPGRVARKVRIVGTDADVASSFVEAGFQVESRPGPVCGYDGLVYYAGRDLASLLSEVNNGCQASPPMLLAGEADPAIRDRYPKIPFEYLNFAVRQNGAHVVAHEATLAYVKAVERVRARGGSGAAPVMQELEAGENDGIVGIMRADGPGDPIRVATCGRHRELTPSPWCP